MLVSGIFCPFTIDTLRCCSQRQNSESQGHSPSGLAKSVLSKVAPTRDLHLKFRRGEEAFIRFSFLYVFSVVPKMIKSNVPPLDRNRGCSCSKKDDSKINVEPALLKVELLYILRRQWWLVMRNLLSFPISPQIGSYKSYKIDVPPTYLQKQHHIIQAHHLEIVIHGVRIRNKFDVNSHQVPTVRTFYFIAFLIWNNSPASFYLIASHFKINLLLCGCTL